MKRKPSFIAALAFCISLTAVFSAQAENQEVSVGQGGGKVVVEIDYGGIQPSKTIEIPLAKGKTVLEALEAVATVETHPVGQYVFVTSIDGVASKRGDMAWYYTVNDQAADELAYSKILTGTEHIKWSYKRDVCSSKLDKNSDSSQKGGSQQF